MLKVPRNVSNLSKNWNNFLSSASNISKKLSTVTKLQNELTIKSPSQSLSVRDANRNLVHTERKLVNPLKHQDFFNVKELVNLEELFK